MNCDICLRVKTNKHIFQYIYKFINSYSIYLRMEGDNGRNRIKAIEKKIENIFQFY